MNFQIRVGDTVEVARGRRNRNPERPPTRGRVLVINRASGRVVIEGHNMRTKNIRRSERRTQTGRIEMEAPIHISNVLVVTDDGDAIPARDASRSDDGKVVRRVKA